MLSCVYLFLPLKSVLPTILLALYYYHLSVAVTCWSYTAVRKWISLNRNASNFPSAIIVCPQQNKSVIFLKMRGIEIFDKSYGKCCTFDCGNCSFHKYLACLIWGCGLGAGGGIWRQRIVVIFFKSWIYLRKPHKSTASL